MHWDGTVTFLRFINPPDFIKAHWTKVAKIRLCSLQPFAFLRWFRMPMGVIGSPNSFQSLMEHNLTELTWMTCVPYLDNWIIFSRTPQEQISRLREIF